MNITKSVKKLSIKKQFIISTKKYIDCYMIFLDNVILKTTLIKQFVCFFFLLYSPSSTKSTFSQSNHVPSKITNSLNSKLQACMFTLNTGRMYRSVFPIVWYALWAALFPLEQPCSITLLKTDSICHARFHFSWKYRGLSLNFDKFLCPFANNPWGFYVHSSFLTAVISWGREHVRVLETAL